MGSRPYYVSENKKYMTSEDKQTTTLRRKGLENYDGTIGDRNRIKFFFTNFTLSLLQKVLLYNISLLPSPPSSMCSVVEHAPNILVPRGSFK